MKLQTIGTIVGIIVGVAVIINFLYPTVIQEKPGPVLNLNAKMNDGQIKLTWSAPSDDGGSPITDYIIQYKKSSEPSFSVYPDGGGSATEALLTGLEKGKNYEFIVSAVNDIGSGSDSSRVSAIPMTIPNKVMNLQAEGDNRNVFLSWSAPSDDGGSPITDYIVEYKRSSDASFSVYPDGGGSATGATLTGLTEGTSYHFRVAAINDVGKGPISDSTTTTPMNTPSKVTNVRPITKDDGQISLSWTAPPDGGSRITDYIVEYKKSSEPSFDVYSHEESALTGITLTDLVEGVSYDFRVSAVNFVGTGPQSDPVSTTPLGTPSQVTNVKANTNSNGDIVLSWSAPFDGGSPITDYIVEYKRSPDFSFSVYDDGVSTSTGATLTGFIEGVKYDFRVSADNNVGTGLESYITNIVVPIGPKPPVPIIDAPIFGVEGSDVHFSAIGSYDQDGGTITGYEWDFGDGFKSTQSTVFHPFSQPGTYTVTLTVFDSQGLSDSKTHLITIDELIEILPISNLKIVDKFGNPTTPSVGEHVQVSVDMSNPQGNDQPFAFVVQLYDDTGNQVWIAWISGTLSAGQSFSPSLGWEPEQGGEFLLRGYIWDNPTDRNRLSTVITLELTI
jgi:PKD repeat protein